MKAFEGFEEVQELDSQDEKQKAWLKDYEGLRYSKAVNGKHLIKWASDPHFYNPEEFTREINKIGRKKDRLVIEFDEIEGEPNNPKEALEEVREKLIEQEIGFIRSTHRSLNSDYLWVEFTRDLTEKEAQRFLAWICPDGARIDMNFAYDKKVFPVLFAPHWKYSQRYEEPIEFHEGNKIDFDILPISKTLPKTTTTTKDGYSYQTFIKDAKKIFGIRGQVEYLYERQPFFYNRSGMFVIWDNEAKKYDVVDEVDILNGISEIGVDTISSKTKSEILNGLKQFGRKKIPKDPPKTWVQFRDKIFDFKTGEEFDASPDYFITNPLPYKPSDSEDTPTIDRLFEEWVGEDYVPTLYEIVAYSCSSHQFLQRLVALVGGGSNGKGTFIKFLTKFIGEENTCSSEIKELSENQFETSTIYKKLLCVMGEVSHDDLKNTNQLKKLSGEDQIRFCFKGKTPFTEDSGTTLLSATNSLPLTPDKTLGFYRRWLIVDFPNQFKNVKGDLIEKIPEEEFENLARKVLGILQRLYKEQKFTNEGDFEERMERYEERSNPVMRFVEEFCEEEAGDKMKLKDFCNEFNNFAKKNHQRILSIRQISKVLKDDGFEIAKRNISHFGEDPVSAVCILHLKLRKLPKLPKLPKSQLNHHRESSSKFGSFGSSGSSELKKVNIKGNFLEVPKVPKEAKQPSEAEIRKIMEEFSYEL